MVTCEFMNKYQKDICLKEIWTTCSTSNDHFKFNGRHNEEGGLHGHFMIPTLVTLEMYSNNMGN